MRCKLLLVRVALAALLALYVLPACDGTSQPRAVSPSPSRPPAALQEAAYRTCGEYLKAALWDYRDIDTNGDGVEDFTDVFPTRESGKQVERIAAEAAPFRDDERFAGLTSAVSLLTTVTYDGPDRMEAADVEVTMDAACKPFVLRSPAA